MISLTGRPPSSSSSRTDSVSSDWSHGGGDASFVSPVHARGRCLHVHVSCGATCSCVSQSYSHMHAHTHTHTHTFVQVYMQVPVYPHETMPSLALLREPFPHLPEARTEDTHVHLASLT